MHCDIRAKNILITNNETAKLANFKLNRLDTSNKQKTNLDHIRYCAPELLRRDQYQYNHKCEVYSFGILLWEIAEARIPYEGHDILKIINLVCKEKYLLRFSENNRISENFKKLTLDGML